MNLLLPMLPSDAIIAANQSACAGTAGAATTFSGLWWTHGTAAVGERFKHIMGNYSLAGGRLDSFVMDTEIWLSAKVLFQKLPGACAQLRSVAIERDPRWAALRVDLAASGLDFTNTSSPGYVQRALQGDPNRAETAAVRVWDNFMSARVAAYLNTAIWGPVKASFPAAATAALTVSNYGFALRNSSRVGCVPDWFGGQNCDPHAYALNGNTQSQSLFYMRFFNPQFEQGLRRAYPAVGSYPKTPFNAFRWSVLLLRQHVISGLAPTPFSDTEDVRFRPWVAYRSYSHGAIVNASDYYQEALLQYLAGGADLINFWNPKEVADLGVEDNRIFGQTLREASSVLGCEGRSWSFPNARAARDDSQMLPF
eukprot:g8248.t1